MIELKKLSINGFRCFSTKSSIDFGKITLLTGANSSGKSSFMYSLLGLLQTEGVPYTYSLNGEYVKLGDYLAIANNHDGNKEIELDIELVDGRVPYEVIIKIRKQEEGNMPIVTSLRCKSTYFEVNAVGDINSGLFKADLDYNPSLSPDPNAQNEALRTERIAYFKDNKQNIEKSRVDFIVSYLSAIGQEIHAKNALVDASTQEYDGSYEKYLVLTDVFISIGHLFDEFNEKFNFISSYRMPPERSYIETQVPNKIGPDGNGFVNTLLKWEESETGKFNELVSALRLLSILDYVHVDKLPGGSFNVNVKVKENGTTTPLSDVGFGVSQMLPIILADVQLGAESTLYAAQPEIHLHPSVQADYGSYLVHEVAKSNKRYIIETHSEYLINRIRLEIVKKNISSDDVKVFFIGEKDGISTITQITFTEDGRILDAPADFLKTYMIDVMSIAMEAAE